MKYIALDQAAKTTGYAIYEDDKLIKSGTFTIPASTNLGKRLAGFYNTLTDIYFKERFNYVFYEGIQLQRNNPDTYRKLAMIQGIVAMWCFSNGLDCCEMLPSHWRKVIKDHYKVSFGRARAEQKKAAQIFVKDHFEMEKSEDECDAICLGLAGILEKGKSESAF